MKFFISSHLIEEMIHHSISTLPEEACGLVGGKDNRGLSVIGVENEVHSSSGYRMDPRQQLEAMLSFEKVGHEMVGIYHSHPNGPEHPSETDVAQAYYPDAVTLILSPGGDGWVCKAFQMSMNGFLDVEIIRFE